MTEEKNLVPKLRFPEFRQSNAWGSQDLGDICEVLNNRRRPITGSDREVGPYPYYGASGIVDFVKEFIFDERLLLVGEDGAKWNAFEKTAFIVEGKYWVNNHAHVLKPNAINDALLENYLTMVDLGPYVTGAAPPKLTLGKLKSIPVPVPPTVAEQQKIADCLSSLDELIAAQGRKVDALKTHKKGLMQQLFPCEGETQPRLRFPEFNNSGPWTESLLGGYLEEYREKSTKQDEYEVMTSARSGLVRQRDYYDNDRITGCENVGFNVLPPNYITYRSRSDDRQFYFNENNLGTIGIVSVYYPVFRIINGSNRYFTELLSAFSRIVGKYSVGTSQTVLSLNQLGKIRLPFPPTVEEQQSIADCLTSVETLITAATQELATLKTHKKGLMQQLFPSAEAVAA